MLTCRLMLPVNSYMQSLFYFFYRIFMLPLALHFTEILNLKKYVVNSLNFFEKF